MWFTEQPTLPNYSINDLEAGASICLPAPYRTTTFTSLPGT